ncbi:ABC transporter substrate-binding protein [archaeon]|jgi:NitT/TauT family transport system substrate-binding protein|nr:ABC transporter substrate-binding protein [archaeon]MBT4022608.1 ABC transporter substrate-binding protein [archaeon]MBT4272048.1 ABC transporter substrate-binding protein [archaeon]MBT4461145.1 ABC transporter substrate-binding protein [archaeon]MBT4858862.1 ABC transporter substrate-binding protein [archaeon]
MRRGLILLLIIIFLTACATTKTTIELDNVDVRLKWLHQAQFSGNYIALDKGFYEQNGLNVSLKKGGVDFSSLQEVLSGESDFGIVGADDLIVAISKGEPVKAVAVIYKLSPVCYFALKESGIKSPHDFVGKKIGIKKGSGTFYSYVSMLEYLNINRNEITEVEIAYDLTSFYNKEIDVWPGFRINEPNTAMENGYEVEIIGPEDWGVTMYADVIVTTVDNINNNPKQVRSFVEATLKGWQYAIENEEETVDIIMNYAIDSSRSHQQNMLASSIPLIHTGDSRLGVMEPKVWENMITILSNNNIIETEVKIEDIFTNEFVG